MIIRIIIFLSFVSEAGKVDPTPHTSSFNMGYLVSPYPYPNGAGGPIPVSMVSKSPVVPLFAFVPRQIWHAADLPPRLVPFVLERQRAASFVSGPPDLT